MFSVAWLIWIPTLSCSLMSSSFSDPKSRVIFFYKQLYFIYLTSQSMDVQWLLYWKLQMANQWSFLLLVLFRCICPVSYVWLFLIVFSVSSHFSFCFLSCLITIIIIINVREPNLQTVFSTFPLATIQLVIRPTLYKPLQIINVNLARFIVRFCN